MRTLIVSACIDLDTGEVINWALPMPLVGDEPERKAIEAARKMLREPGHPDEVFHAAIAQHMLRFVTGDGPRPWIELLPRPRTPEGWLECGILYRWSTGDGIRTLYVAAIQRNIGEPVEFHS